jgi:hypothetical protein
MRANERMHDGGGRGEEVGGGRGRGNKFLMESSEVDDLDVIYL